MTTNNTSKYDLDGGYFNSLGHSWNYDYDYTTGVGELTLMDQMLLESLKEEEYLIEYV